MFRQSSLMICPYGVWRMSFRASRMPCLWHVCLLRKSLGDFRLGFVDVEVGGESVHGFAVLPCQADAVAVVVLDEVLSDVALDDLVA